jgi:hypothetical protein
VRRRGRQPVGLFFRATAGRAGAGAAPTPTGAPSGCWRWPRWLSSTRWRPSSGTVGGALGRMASIRACCRWRSGADGLRPRVSAAVVSRGRAPSGGAVGGALGRMDPVRMGCRRRFGADGESVWTVAEVFRGMGGLPVRCGSRRRGRGRSAGWPSGEASSRGTGGEKRKNGVDRSGEGRRFGAS